MHRGVDAVREQRLLDLLGKQALAADLGQRAVLLLVTGGLDDHGLDSAVRGKLGMGGGQTGAHLARLGERER